MANWPVEMLSRKYGEPSHEVRRALMDSGVAIDSNDEVDIEAADKADAKIRKFLDDHNAARKAAKDQVANWAEEKRKWLEAHNKKVAAGTSEE